MRHFRAVGQVETPYHTAWQRWAGHVGLIIEAKQAWKWAFFLTQAGLIGTLYFYGVKLDRKPPVELVYVALDADGIATVLGKAPGLNAPTKLMVEERIERFVKLTRGLILDRDAVRRQWLEDAYRWVTPRGSQLLNEWALEREPLIKVGKISIEVKINQKLRLSDASYEVRWTEILRNQNNGKTETSQWSGNYVTVVEKPKSVEEARANATGVFIDYFTATRTR